ncbi:MAG TPA: hypothetical protein VGQ83_01445 [Polyangia bacterium]
MVAGTAAPALAGVCGNGVVECNTCTVTNQAACGCAVFDSCTGTCTQAATCSVTSCALCGGEQCDGGA